VSISHALSLPLASLSGLAQWPLFALIGILAILFIIVLFGSQRRQSETALLSGHATLPPGTLRGYVLALVDAERFADAIPLAQVHLRTVPGDVRMRALLAVLTASQGDLLGANEEYHRVIGMLDREPRGPAASGLYRACLYAAHAENLRALDRHDEAIAQMRQAEALDPSLASHRNASIDLLIDFARTEELERRAFEDLLEWERGRAQAAAFGIADVAEAVNFYAAAAQTHPTNARVRGDLAQALHASGDHRAAEHEFREALRLNPADPWLHYFQGLMHWRLQLPTEAEHALTEAARLSPRQAAIRGTLGVFFMRQSRFSQAEHELLAAVESRPEVWALTRVYGAAMLRDGRLMIAAQAFAQAEHYGANDLTFRLAFAEVKEKLGDNTGAGDQYQLAIHLDPTRGIARAEFGGFLLRQGRLREAENELREAFLLPESAAAHGHMARLMLVERRLDEVVHHLQIALQFEPQSPELKACQSEWLLLQHRPTDAHDLARQILIDEPNSAMAQLARGGALLEMNRQLEAESALRDAVRIAPALPDQLLAWSRGLHAIARIHAALDAVNQALMLRPDWPDALAELDLLVQAQQSEHPGRQRISLGPLRL
jgi:tetratricopeptide (TPR) repeat protein